MENTPDIRKKIDAYIEEMMEKRLKISDKDRKSMLKKIRKLAEDEIKNLDYLHAVGPEKFAEGEYIRGIEEMSVISTRTIGYAQELSLLIKKEKQQAKEEKVKQFKQKVMSIFKKR